MIPLWGKAHLHKASTQTLSPCPFVANQDNVVVHLPVDLHIKAGDLCVQIAVAWGCDVVIFEPKEKDEATSKLKLVSTPIPTPLFAPPF